MPALISLSFMKPQFDMGGEAADFRLPTFQLNGIPTSGTRPVLG
jgi:hypothetical protein